ncbi:LysR family transcriptional regulator [Sphingomonas sp.]|uniref:LysR family transcriptional regulator n=1 Tax=Sphingomonas sp. TaxID=28214 RepID=UPI000DB5677B|nr:LysR family transcriptional regulator [Sphingomonas sp.]PZU10220.1 MAG: LysR family transcriptional regulator [Sphingomonas sp.]
MPAFSRFLKYFMAVGRHGSIRRAAEELNVAASSIDRQILNAEAQLGMALFERLPGGLRLSAAGEIMMAAGQRWQKGLDDVHTQIEDLRGLKRGHVEIAMIDALTKGLIPSIIRSVQSLYPGITVKLRVLDNDAVRLAISEGTVDFGIFFYPQSFRDISVKVCGDVVLGFVTPVGHPLGRKREARFSEAVGLKIVAPAEPLAMCDQISVLEGATGVALDRAVTSDNIQMMASLVTEGVGIGILTSLDVSTEVRRGLLEFTRISDAILRPMTLALCTATNRTLSNAAGIILSEIESRFAQLTSPSGPNGMEPLAHHRTGS